MSRKSALLGLSAIGLVLSAPAFAQTVLNPQEITGVNTQSGTNTLGSSATGLTGTAFGNQGNSNSLNQIGTSGFALTPGSATFGFGQSIGAVNPTGLTPATTFNQSAGNTISAGSTSGFLSNVNAGLSGGNQSATNGVNAATFNVLAGSTGSLQQVINNTQSDIGLTPSTLQSATNSITAGALAGNAAINGNGNGQIATNTMNTAAALLPSAGTTLGLDQKGPAAAIGVTNTNIATANVTNSTNPVLDPSVSNLSQSSNFSLNTLATSGGPLTLTNGGSPTHAGQYAIIPTTGSGSSSTVSTGNVAVAYTGSTGVGPAIAGPALGVITPAVGTSQINAVTQSNGLTINSASNGGATTYGDSASPFLQTADTRNLTVSGQSVNGLTNQANVLLASTRQGGASVSGTPLSATNTVASQYNGANINAAASSGAASGYLSQEATGGLTSLANTANATVSGPLGSGNASVTNISQAQSLNANTLSANGGNGLTLQQNASSVSLGGSNSQTASTPIGVASLTGAVQQMGSTVNAANLSGVVSGTIQQSAASTTQNTSNSLASSGGAATTAGSQSSNNAVNVIR